MISQCTTTAFAVWNPLCDCVRHVRSAWALVWGQVFLIGASGLLPISDEVDEVRWQWGAGCQCSSSRNRELCYRPVVSDDRVVALASFLSGRFHDSFWLHRFQINGYNFPSCWISFFFFFLALLFIKSSTSVHLTGALFIFLLLLLRVFHWTDVTECLMVAFL